MTDLIQSEPNFFQGYSRLGRKGNLLLFQLGLILFQLGSILFQLGSILFQLGSILFQLGFILFQLGSILFQLGLILFHSNFSLRLIRSSPGPTPVQEGLDPTRTPT